MLGFNQLGLLYCESVHYLFLSLCSRVDPFLLPRGYLCDTSIMRREHKTRALQAEEEVAWAVYIVTVEVVRGMYIGNDPKYDNRTIDQIIYGAIEEDSSGLAASSWQMTDEAAIGKSECWDSPQLPEKSVRPCTPVLFLGHTLR